MKNIKNDLKGIGIVLLLFIWVLFIFLAYPFVVLGSIAAGLLEKLDYGVYDQKEGFKATMETIHDFYNRHQ